MSSMKTIASRALAALGLLVWTPGVQALADEGPPPAPVQVSYALEQEMAPRLWVPGTVASLNETLVATEVSGLLTWVAEVGDRVGKGEPLARIDDQSLRLRLRDDEATIKRLEAQLAYLEQQTDRIRRLTEQQIAPANDLEEAQSQREAVEQQLVQAHVARERTLFELERCVVRAPFSGEVVERFRQPGGYGAVGGEIARLVDTANLEVRARAPLSVAPHIREGSEVVVSDRSREIAGSIRRIVPVGDERSRMFEIRIALAERPWLVGTPVRVALPTNGPRKVIAVPRDALILRSEGVYVFRVTDAGTAERLTVETGMGHASLIEVRGDLRPGDQVVIRGGERLRPGQTVTVSSGSLTSSAG